MDRIPAEIDIHYIEESAGNNCALVACKANSYNMIVFLHTKCNADFSLINKYNENAINVLAVGSCDNSSETANCLEYLATVIEIDITHNYQETLIMLQDPSSVVIAENLLKAKGICTSKKDLDHENFKSNRGTFTSGFTTGNRFTFIKLFPELNMRGTLASDDFSAINDFANSP